MVRPPREGGMIAVRAPRSTAGHAPGWQQQPRDMSIFPMRRLLEPQHATTARAEERATEELTMVGARSS